MISVSDLSYLGFCQIAFLFNKKAKIVTKAMMQGAMRHNELQREVEAFTDDEIIKKIAEGDRFVAREISVSDHENGLRGRIDELQFLGHNEGRKNEVLIRDDKFSYSNFLGMSDAHRIQLSSYAFMMPNDAKFKNLVDVVGASINFRRFNTSDAMEFKVSGNQLDNWTGHIPELTRLAGSILSNEIVPQSQGFSLVDSEWLPVSKRTCTSCKYNKVCKVGRKILSE